MKLESDHSDVLGNFVHDTMDAAAQPGAAEPKSVDVVIIPVAFKANNELGDCLDRAREVKVSKQHA